MKQLRYIYLCVLVSLWAIQATHAMPSGSLASGSKSIWLAAQQFDGTTDDGAHIAPSRLSQFHKHSRHSRPNTYRVGGLLPVIVERTVINEYKADAKTHAACYTIHDFSTALLLIYPHHYFW